MYFIGINVPFNCSMEDPVEDYILKEKLNNDRDLWDEQCWGFYDEIDLKLFREDLFLDVDEDGIQTNIKTDNKFKKEFIDFSSGFKIDIVITSQNTTKSTHRITF